MNGLVTPESVAATVATYAIEGAWDVVGPLLGGLTPAPQVPQLPRVAMTIYAGRSAFRWDLLDARSRRPVISIVRFAAEPAWLLDHRAKTYRAVELLAQEADAQPRLDAALRLDAAPRLDAVLPGPESPFGPTLQAVLPLGPQGRALPGAAGEVRLSVLEGPALPALETWWRLWFPGRATAGAGLRRRLPYICELRAAQPPGSGRDPAVARLALQSLDRTTQPAAAFRPPKGYQLAAGEAVAGSLPLPPRPAPPWRQGLARESAIAALLAGGNDELVKLQLRNEVVDRLAAGANALSARIGAIRGEEGLELDLRSVLDELRMATPATPAGSPSIAYLLLLRLLFWHWGSAMKPIFESDDLRSRLWQVVEVLDMAASMPMADTNAAAAAARAIEPPRTAPAEGRALFRSMRDFIVEFPGACLPPLKSLRDYPMRCDVQVAALATQGWPAGAGEPQAQVARQWFLREFSKPSLQPKIGLTGDHDRQEGWLKDKYKSEGIAELIDMELSVGSVLIGIDNAAILGPAAAIDDTDPRFQVIDAADDDSPLPGSRKRAGVAATLTLSRLEASGSLTTIPTTNSPAVVALALLAPHEFLKLWNYVDATITVRGITADVLVYFEQERLSPAGPALKVAITNFGAASLDVGGFALSPDPFLTALFNPILNVLLDRVTPALLDRLLAELFRTIEGIVSFAEEAVETIFDRTLPPRAPLTPPNVSMDLQESLTQSRTVGENIRLQTLLNLNREGEFERLSSLAAGAPELLEQFLNGWPQGQTGCEVVNEPGGYRVGLAICRPGFGGTARALVYPPAGVAQAGDVTLLLSAGMFRQMLADLRLGYRGAPRATDSSPAVLPQLPEIDWWRDAQEPARLGARPADLRTGPPQLPPGPSTSPASDWRAYWSRLEVAVRGVRLLPVQNPAPGQRVAEITLGVAVQAGVTTYTAVQMERCGPDLTRLAGELDRPPLDDPGRFRPPLGPGGPRPRPDGGPLRAGGIDVEVGFRRVPHGLEPAIVTATDLAAARVRYGGGDGGNGSGDLLNVEGALYARPGFGGVFAGDADCDIISAWDVRSRELWLDAGIELQLPVFVGLANHGPTDPVRLHDERLLGARARLPILTWRFGTDPVGTGPFSLQVSGPLAGLAQGGNAAWLRTLLLNHARALVGNSTDPHREGQGSPLRYAYGFNSDTIQLEPEGFRPYAIVALHPTYWSGATPPAVTDPNPPDLRLETFGPDPENLSLAINLFVTESVLGRLGM